MRRVPGVRMVAITLAVLALAACGGSGESARDPAAGTFVGTLAGSDAYVAVVAGKKNVVAYVCDGKNGIGQLFTGRRADETFTAQADGASIEVALGDDGVSGSVTLADAGPARFTAKPAGGEAGFYRRVTELDGREVRLGWVVLGDGTQRGALVQSRAITSAPSLQPSTGSFTLSGRTMTAVRVVGGGVDDLGQLGFGGQFGG